MFQIYKQYKTVEQKQHYTPQQEDGLIAVITNFLTVNKKWSKHRSIKRRTLIEDLELPYYFD